LQRYEKSRLSTKSKVSHQAAPAPAGCRFALARSRVPDFGAMTTAEESSARAGGAGCCCYEETGFQASLSPFLHNSSARLSSSAASS